MPVFSRGETHVLFAHVPKTGGSAVETAFLRSGYAAAYREIGGARQGARAVRRCSPQHWHAAVLEQVIALDALTASFAVVREPLARFRSEYAHRERQTGRGTDEQTVERWGMRMLRRHAEDPYWKDNHFRPQHEFVTPGMQVFRYEDGLDRCLDWVRDQGIEVSAGLPVVNTPRDGVRSVDVPLSARLRDALVEVYRADYDRFGYPAP